MDGKIVFYSTVAFLVVTVTSYCTYAPGVKNEYCYIVTSQPEDPPQNYYPTTTLITAHANVGSVTNSTTTTL